MNSNKFTIDSNYTSVTDLISSLRDKNFYSDLTERLKGEIEICLVEALNNVVRHSFKEESGNEIIVELNISDTLLEIIIREAGIPRPDLGKPTLDFDPEDIENIPEGGMGLFIIDQLMDETDYTSTNGTNILTMKKNLN